MTVWGSLSRALYREIAASASAQLVFHFHNPLTVGLLGYLPPHSICTLHGFVGNITQRKISKFITAMTIKRMLRQNILLVGCCRAVAQFINNTYHTDQCRWVLNGVGPIVKQKSVLPYTNNNVHIGYAATIDELKGWRILAKAYELLPQEVRTRCDLSFAGSLDPRDRADFEAFLQRFPAVSYVGAIPHAADTFIPYLDILVLPSRTEGLPMSILEAMQLGVVPVATAVGGIPEIIEDNQSGFLIERDAAQLARLLEHLLTHPQHLAQVKEQARKRFFEVGTADMMSQKYQQIYEQLINRYR